MNYTKYVQTDLVNGEGVRCTLFVSGCSHGCSGCYNESTWNPKSGNPFTKEMEDQIIKDLKDTTINRQGLSLSGGDPMHKRNVKDMIALCKRVREECPTKDIWLWTGYTLDELLQGNNADRKELLLHIDVLIDGKFEENLYDPALEWRGSSNQTVTRFGRIK